MRCSLIWKMRRATMRLTQNKAKEKNFDTLFCAKVFIYSLNENAYNGIIVMIYKKRRFKWLKKLV